MGTLTPPRWEQESCGGRCGRLDWPLPHSPGAQGGPVELTRACISIHVADRQLLQPQWVGPQAHLCARLVLESPAWQLALPRAPSGGRGIHPEVKVQTQPPSLLLPVPKSPLPRGRPTQLPQPPPLPALTSGGFRASVRRPSKQSPRHTPKAWRAGSGAEGGHVTSQPGGLGNCLNCASLSCL